MAKNLTDRQRQIEANARMVEALDGSIRGTLMPLALAGADVWLPARACRWVAQSGLLGYYRQERFDVSRAQWELGRPWSLGRRMGGDCDDHTAWLIALARRLRAKRLVAIYWRKDGRLLHVSPEIDGEIIESIPGMRRKRPSPLDVDRVRR